jgi:Fe-S cluster assembly protein SufD
VTLLDQPAARVAEAVESSRKVASRLHPPGSFELADHPVPTGREEAWRFTPLKRLKGLHDGTFTPGGRARVELEAPPTVTLEIVGRDDPRLGRVDVPNDRVAAQAWTSFEQARILSVPAGVELDEPVLLNVFGTGSEGAVFNHLVIDIGANAKATIVLQHQGSTVRAGNAEIVVGDGASLMLVSVQDWDDDAVHLAHLHARVGRDASYRQALVSIGGDLVRIASSVDFAAPGGEA